MIKKILIMIDDDNSKCKAKFSNDVSITNILNSIKCLSEKVIEINYYDALFELLNKIYDSELDDPAFMRSIVKLSEKIREKKPNLEPNEFVEGFLKVIYHQGLFEAKSSDVASFLDSLDYYDYLALTQKEGDLPN